MIAFGRSGNRKQDTNKCPQGEESYGCEFIDDGQYGAPHPEPSQPWKLREYSYPVIELPIKFLLELMDKKYMLDIKNKDFKQIEALRQSIIEVGLEHPGVVYYDNFGRMCLGDGNHRLLALSTIPTHKTMPVQVIRASGSVKAGRLNVLSDVPNLLLLLAGQEPAPFS